MSETDALLPVEHMDDWLEDLAGNEEVPVIALTGCLAHFDVAAPRLRPILEEAASGARLDETDANLFFHAFHLLGAGRDSLSFKPLLRLLRLSEEEMAWLLGDAAAVTLPQVAAGMFDGDADALFEAISDRQINEHIRSSLIGAAAFLTWEGRVDRGMTERFLQRFYDDRLADDGDAAWDSWQEAIALLGLRSFVPLVERARADDLLPDMLIDEDFFAEELARAESFPSDVTRFSDAGLGYIEDIVETLESFGFDDEEEDLYDLPDAGYEDGDRAPLEPAVNPFRHVGRNDPCPCGSGKKAKKCCMG